MLTLQFQRTSAMSEDRWGRLLLQFLRNPGTVFFVSYTVLVMIWPVTFKLARTFTWVRCFRTCSWLMLPLTQFTAWNITLSTKHVRSFFSRKSWVFKPGTVRRKAFIIFKCPLFLTSFHQNWNVSTPHCQIPRNSLKFFLNFYMWRERLTDLQVWWMCYFANTC